MTIHGIGGLGIGLQNGNRTALQAGEAHILAPGDYMFTPGLYTSLEYLDPISGLWFSSRENQPCVTRLITSDGGNIRIVNRTGCPVGAVMTNLGSGYTSAPSVVEATTTGGSLWKAILGPYLSLTQTVSADFGANYTYPPRMVIDPPPAGGLQATGYCSLSSGKIHSITITNEGAGYTAGAPYARFFTDDRDPNGPVIAGSAATITPGAPFLLTLQASTSAKVAAIVCTDFGAPVTSLPTLTISGGGGSSAAATVLMNWCVTGYTVSGGGSFGTGTFITTAGGINTSATASLTNPDYELGLTNPRPARMIPALSSGAIVASGTTAPTVDDWGYGFQKIPILVPVDGKGLATTAVTTLTATVGGQTDSYFIARL